MLQPHTLKSTAGARRGKKILGRGESSGWGKTSGRGTKGQRARSGGRKGLKLFGSRALILSTKKLRGFHSPYGHSITITLAQLQQKCTAGALLTPPTLVKMGLVPSVKSAVKIVASGALDKKISLKGIAVSAGAKAAIEKAGGTVA